MRLIFFVERKFISHLLDKQTAHFYLVTKYALGILNCDEKILGRELFWNLGLNFIVGQKKIFIEIFAFIANM